MIEYCAEDIALPDLNFEQISTWIEQIAHINKCCVGQLCYVFCSDDYILEMNKKHLQHDYYTDIITFDYSEENIISGDLFISIDTVRTNANAFLQSYNAELLRVIVHGVLHLCGLGDKTPSEEKQMRRAEDEALDLILGQDGF